MFARDCKKNMKKKILFLFYILMFEKLKRETLKTKVIQLLIKNSFCKKSFIALINYKLTFSHQAIL